MEKTRRRMEAEAGGRGLNMKTAGYEARLSRLRDWYETEVRRLMSKYTASERASDACREEFDELITSYEKGVSDLISQEARR